MTNMSQRSTVAGESVLDIDDGIKSSQRSMAQSTVAGKRNDPLYRVTYPTQWISTMKGGSQFGITLQNIEDIVAALFFNGVFEETDII